MDRVLNGPIMESRDAVNDGQACPPLVFGCLDGSPYRPTSHLSMYANGASNRFSSSLDAHPPHSRDARSLYLYAQLAVEYQVGSTFDDFLNFMHTRRLNKASSASTPERGLTLWESHVYTPAAELGSTVVILNISRLRLEYCLMPSLLVPLGILAPRLA